MHPAALVSRTVMSPLTVPKVTVTDAPEGFPTRAAPVGSDHAYIEPALLGTEYTPVSRAQTISSPVTVEIVDGSSTSTSKVPPGPGQPKLLFSTTVMVPLP